MQRSLLTLALFALCCFAITAQAGNNKRLTRGNSETVQAFDAALLELFQDGTYNQIHLDAFGNLPSRFSDCVEDPAALSYPTDISKKGLLDSILKDGSIKLGYFIPIATPPTFVVDAAKVPIGGFYPELAEAILERVAMHYGVAGISIQWVAIPDVPGFNAGLYAGDFDAIWLNLFKAAMWSAPVAPRPELWDFTCGLLTVAPLRYYVCPSAIAKEIDPSLPSTIDSPNTNVGVFFGGAQEAAARTHFPSSVILPGADIDALVAGCEDGSFDIVVELPARVGGLLSEIAPISGTLGTSVNTGGAFRYDDRGFGSSSSATSTTSTSTSTSTTNTSTSTSDEE